MKLNAELLMLAGGVAAFVVTMLWVRGRDLREKYAVVWMLAATLLLLCGLFPRLLMSFAEHAKLGYASAALFVSLAAVYVFSFSVSVSLTRQHRRNMRLTQELALMENRVRALEAAHASRDGAKPSAGE
jgi:hypothetical protein